MTRNLLMEHVVGTENLWMKPKDELATELAEILKSHTQIFKLELEVGNPVIVYYWE